MNEPAAADVLDIHLFGGFSIACGDRVLSYENNRTRQVWLLIEFLIANRHVEVSSSRLIEVLWGTKEIDNPANALKNLVYRARTLLSKVGRTPENEYILFSNGAYSWNNAIPCVIDTEQLEVYHNAGSDLKSEPQVRMENYLKAISLYRGDILQMSSDADWAVPISIYYRGIFFDCVYSICDLLFSLKRFSQIDAVCSKAASVDPLEENVYILNIKALIAMGKYAKAAELYRYVNDLFIKEFGTRPSDEIRGMYREIIKGMNNGEASLITIRDDLMEADKAKGAYYCDYEIFRDMYRLTARSLGRSETSAVLCVLTLTEKKDTVLSVSAKNKIMDILKTVLIESLRKGDIVSRFSVTQYVILLPSASPENIDVIISRIEKNFHNTYKGNLVLLSERHIALEPAQ